MRFALAVVAACHAATPSSPVDVETVAARFVDAFTNTTPRLTADGRVVFISNRDGLPQLYVGDIAHPDAAPVHLPTPKERVVDPQLMPDGKTIVFLSDVGSDQKYHVFRIGLDGRDLRDLTPDPEQRRGNLLVSRGNGLMIYTQHTLTDQTTHVMAQALDGEPREVYHDASVVFVGDLSADGSHALLIRVISDASSIALSLDVATGATTRLYPPEGQEAAIGDVAFSADGKAAYVASDRAGQPMHIVKLDPSGHELAHYDEATIRTATSAGVHPSPTGDRVLAVLDAGDHFEARMLDADLELVATPKIPLGTIAYGSYSPDGKRIGVTLRGTAAPTDIASLDVATLALTPLRADTRPGLGDPPKASIVHLTAFDGLTLPANLYLPEHGSGRLPTLVLVHGGPSGSSTIGWSSTVGFFIAMGYAVVEPNIRGSTGFGIAYMDADNREHRGDALRDMETINQWARAQPWCDPDRIVIGGISYGGYMTLLALSRQPKLWHAGIDGSGMSNLVTMEQLEDQQIRAFDDTEFGTLGKDDALLREWSPITHVADIVAPVFVYQGVNDPVTPQHEADQIVEALRARNVPVEYMLLGGEGHGVTRRANIIAYLARSYRFVSSH